jgi:hypothetical protein
MNAVRRPALLAVALALAGLLACNADHTSGPSGGTPTSDSPPPAPLTEEQLQSWESDEKARVDAEREASRATYDSLKIEWDLSRNQYPEESPGLVRCEPLEYAADVKIIGPDGGDLSIGPHRLSIPKGALETKVVVTGEMPVSMAVTVRLLPHGLVFAVPPKLTLDYEHCSRSKDYKERVVYTDEELNPLEFPLAKDYTDYEYVDAWLDHFSRYAVWY